jgi:DNA polymerase-3 subunit beta
LNVSAKAEVNSATEDLEVTYTGGEFVIGFSAKYLMQILKLIDDDVSVWKFGDPGSPAIVTPKRTPAATFVLMPMRV